MADLKIYLATKEQGEEIISKLDALALDIAPIGHVVYHVRTVSGDAVTLRWKDPSDGPRVTWLKTVIVKKQGAAPESPTDGTVVVASTIRDQYAATGYTDTQSGADGWVYRAFPTSVAGAVSMSAENIFTPYELYEYYIDEGLSDPEQMVVYEGQTSGATQLSIDKTVDPSPSAINWGSFEEAFFMPKPCMLNGDGTVAYYLDPDDYTKKADGTSSDITDLTFDGNAMMEFPRVYMAANKIGSRIHVKICDQKLDETFECFPCLKANGDYATEFYMPIYEGYMYNGKLRSMCPADVKCNSGAAQSTQVTNARANGTGWDVTTQAQEEIIKALGVLVFKRLDIPAACGGDRSVTASSAQIVIGGGNQFGMFGGKFDGSWTTCKFFGMENWWGNVGRRAIGVVLIDSEWGVKMTKHRGDGSGADDYVWSDNAPDYAGKYHMTGIRMPTTYSNAYITEVGGILAHDADKGVSCVFLPRVAAGGGSAAKYCDAVYSSTGLRGAVFGGYASSGASCGPFCVYANVAPSFSNWFYGASLSYTRF